MKNIMNSITSRMRPLCKHLLCMTAVLGFAVASPSCSDWTEMEEVGVEVPSDKDSEAYKQYLALLRDYRNSQHKIVYVEFDNVAKPVSRAHHLESLPDSVDFVLMNNPEVLPEWICTERENLRTQKGIKFLYAVDFEALEAEYEELVADEENPLTDSFVDYSSERMDRMFALCDSLHYDGLTLRYNGKSTLIMTDEQRAEFVARQELILSKTEAWIESHPDHLFFYEGRPEFLLEKKFLQHADYLILTTRDASDVRQLTLRALTSLKPNVPTNNILVAVSTPSLDPSDSATGYFKDANGNSVSALTETAYWVVTNDTEFTKAGMVIASVANDYHNGVYSYNNVRNAMSIMNPTPKN